MYEYDHHSVVEYYTMGGLLTQEQALDMIEEREAREKGGSRKTGHSEHKRKPKSLGVCMHQTEDMGECSFESTVYVIYFSYRWERNLEDL